MSNMYCIIPITSLTVSPYSLQVGDLIRFKVRAYNSRGWGEWSVANSEGVLAQKVPSQMDVPFTDSSITSYNIVNV